MWALCKTCKRCLLKVSGVSSASPSLKDNNVVIEYVGNLNLDLIIENIKKAGYIVEE